MKRLLITGFEPFGEDEINSSWEAVFELPNEIGGYTIEKLRLPVIFGDAAEIAIKAAEKSTPDVILCIGQAGGGAAITPELVGINLRHANIPDNKGNQPKDEPIILGGTAAYFSTLPMRLIAEAISSVGISSKVSYSADTYVCNDLLYTLLARFDGSKIRIGFIHVPYSTDQNKKPSMPHSDIIKGLIIAIESIN